MEKTTAINKAWHAAHPMPKNPTLQQRIDWHLAHQQHCNCRPGFPAKLLEALKEKKIKLPAGVKLK